MKLSAAQVATLAALRECLETRPWMGSETIVDQGGSLASLPKLLSLDLIEERPHPSRSYRRQWRIKPAA